MMNVRIPRQGDFVRGVIDGTHVTGVVKKQNPNGKLQVEDGEENLYLVDDPTSLEILRSLTDIDNRHVAEQLHRLQTRYRVSN